MENGLWKEIWKPIHFDFEYTNDSRYEVSNWGRVRSYTKTSEGRILKGSMTEGYKILRLKLYKERTPKDEALFQEIKKEISGLFATRRSLMKSNSSQNKIDEVSKLINKKKAELSKKLHKNLLKRTINQHFLIHRLVATYFLPQPTPQHVVVAHIDYDKLNNRVNNLKWMTPEENFLHQSQSPRVIEEKANRKYKKDKTVQGHKLTSSQVLHIKMQLKRNRPVKEIAKQYSISEMQVSRIKSGENWAHVQLPEWF